MSKLKTEKKVSELDRAIDVLESHRMKPSKTNKTEKWEKRFIKIWKNHIDWVGSGFRYNSPSLTAEGLKIGKNVLQEFISTLLKEQKEEIEKGIAILIRQYPELKVSIKSILYDIQNKIRE